MLPHNSRKYFASIDRFIPITFILSCSDVILFQAHAQIEDARQRAAAARAAADEAARQFQAERHATERAISDERREMLEAAQQLHDRLQVSPTLDMTFGSVGP